MLKVILEKLKGVLEKKNSVSTKVTADKWAQKQIQQMARLRSRIVLM